MTCLVDPYHPGRVMYTTGKVENRGHKFQVIATLDVQLVSDCELVQPEGVLAGPEDRAEHPGPGIARLLVIVRHIPAETVQIVHFGQKVQHFNGTTTEGEEAKRRDDGKGEGWRR